MGFVNVNGNLKKEFRNLCLCLFTSASCRKMISYMFDMAAEEANGTLEDSVTEKWSQSLMRLS